MISTANYILPILGLLLCIVVMLLKRINTRGPICAAKLNLYALGWLMLLLANFRTDYAPPFEFLLFIFIMLINNLLYIKLITIKRPIKFKSLRLPKIKH